MVGRTVALSLFLEVNIKLNFRIRVIEVHGISIAVIPWYSKVDNIKC